MIANITKGNFLPNFINYNEKKVAIGDAELLFNNNVFLNNEKYMMIYGSENKAKNKFFHISLNFHTDDIQKLNNETLENITTDYLESMGLDKVPYIVYKHNDTGHPHVHIVVSNSDHNGKIIVQKHERWKSQKITRELEIKYNITQVNSIKKLQKLPEQNIQFNSLKDELNYNIDFLLNKYKVQSYTEFEKELNNRSINITALIGLLENDKGELKSYNGIIYNKFTEDFKQSQRGIKASGLINKPTIINIEKAFKYNQIQHKSKRNEIRKNIDYILTRYDNISIDTFKKLLDNKNIGINVKYDNSDNLVGISYFDKSNNYKYTGEQIGKNYTAKNFKHNFASQSILKPEVITNMEFNKYINKFKTDNTYNNIQHLISIGFKVNYINNSLYINHFSNKDKNGYMLFKENVNINSDFISNYLAANSIDFNNISDKNILFFNYNKAVLDNNIDDINKYEFLINKDDKQLLNNNTNNIDYMFQDEIVSNSDNIHEDKHISDIDKNRKKKNLFKRGN